MRHIFPRLIIISALFLILACTRLAAPTAEPAATLPQAFVPTSISTSTYIPTSVPPPSATATAITIATALPVNTSPQLVVLADHLSQPDDLLLAPDGSIYLSDVGDGTVKRYTQANGLQPLLSGLSVPEGMVLLPDGTLIIAEQGNNRLIRFDPVTQAITDFLDLRNTTGQEGVDGLAWDASSRTIILPDSPNGTVLRVSADAITVTQIASGFARPTGAWVEPDGSILVVDENGNSLSRIHPDGSVQSLGAFPIPDDVIEDGSGNIFVITLGDNAIHFISAATGQDTILSRQTVQPQGLIFDADGNLVVTDPGNHRLVKLVIH